MNKSEGAPKDDDDDLGATFRAMRQHGQEKRAKNLVTSLELLRARGHEPVELNEYHYRLGDYDFWPSTGKWVNRKAKVLRYGRGVFGLLSKLEKKQ